MADGTIMHRDVVYSKSYNNQVLKNKVSITASLSEQIFEIVGYGNSDINANIANDLSDVVIKNYGTVQVTKISHNNRTFDLALDNYFRGIITSNADFTCSFYS